MLFIALQRSSFGVPRSKCGADGCGETQQVEDKMRCDGRCTPGERNRGRCVAGGVKAYKAKGYEK